MTIKSIASLPRIRLNEDPYRRSAPSKGFYVDLFGTVIAAQSLRATSKKAFLTAAENGDSGSFMRSGCHCTIKSQDLSAGSFHSMASTISGSPYAEIFRRGAG